VPEWPKGRDCKSRKRKHNVSSNLTASSRLSELALRVSDYIQSLVLTFDKTY
jgi:hypothetical protein